MTEVALGGSGPRGRGRAVPRGLRASTVWMVCAWVAFWVNYFHSTLTLSSPLANVLAFAAANAIPLVLLARIALGGRESQVWLRAIAALVVAPLAVSSLLLLLGATAEVGAVLRDGDRTMFALRASVPTRWGVLRAYEAGCGAVCADWILVRHEVPVFPGLGVLAVQELHRERHASGARIRRVGADEYRVTILADRGEGPDHTFHVAPPCAGRVVRPLACLRPGWR